MRTAGLTANQPTVQFVASHQQVRHVDQLAEFCGDAPCQPISNFQ